MFYTGQPDLLERPAQQIPAIQVTPPAETLPDPMDVGETGPGTSAVDELSEATSEESRSSLQIIVNEPIPEASHTSKRVRGKVNTLKEKFLKKKKKHTQQMKSMRAV